MSVLHKQHLYALFCVVLIFNVYVRLFCYRTYTHTTFKSIYDYKNKNLYIPKITKFEYILFFGRISNAIFVLSNAVSNVVFFCGFDRYLQAVFRSGTILGVTKKKKTVLTRRARPRTWTSVRVSPWLRPCAAVCSDCLLFRINTRCVSVPPGGGRQRRQNGRHEIIDNVNQYLLRIPRLSPLMLKLRPSNSPFTAFKFFRISSGSCRGVHELLRRLLFAYGVVSSGSVTV